MQVRVLSTLLAVAMTVGLSGCEISGIRIAGFRFTTPGISGLVSGADAEFVLGLPRHRQSVRIWLDDVLLDEGDWNAVGMEARGSLAGVAPGTHELRAEATLFMLLNGIPVVVETQRSFEMVAAPGFSVRESVEQLHVTHAVPGAELEVWGASGQVVAEGTADWQGSLVFRELEPGSGYRVVTAALPREASAPLTVQSIEGSTPAQAFYDAQVLEPGYGYITTRDGTQLSTFVTLPGPIEEGPYPTLINYSGYDPSQPAGPLVFGTFDLCTVLGAEFPIACDAPGAPDSMLAAFLGFATVGVNMRGTACSGGAYDFFEPLQKLDGYDIVETVAAQPWVQGVGMVGISFPGISQLFVASTHPPSLDAITPLAVISGPDTTMNPGGITNDGFAVEWATNVLDGADPYGHGWEDDQVAAGDTICEENQLLHSQKLDIIQKAYDNPFYVSEIYDPLTPRSFVDTIEVPVFTSGAWQDEQTGGHFPDLWTRFTGAPVVKYTAYNGAHADGFTPTVLAEMKNFLDFYVTGYINPISPTVRSLGPTLFREVFGALAPIPPERFSPEEDFETQRAAYEAEPPVRILMEAGGVPGRAGAPIPRYELLFDSWPPPETVATRYYLHADGSLRSFTPSEAESGATFEHDDAKGQETYEVNDSFERALANITWLPEQAGRQAAFLTEPFAEEVVMVGHGSADLWIQSTATDADLEVLLSEVRPDGNEMYITNGWLRASRRALSPESTETKPVQTHVEADAAPLPPGEWTLVRIEIYPFAHAFRPGSQLRLAVSTPGGNKGRWRFDTLQLGEATHAVAHEADHPSSIVLSVIPDVDVPDEIPPCPSLRSQFCRVHVPQANTPFPTE
jgi:predicted acyl esterase